MKRLNLFIIIFIILLKISFGFYPKSIIKRKNSKGIKLFSEKKNKDMSAGGFNNYGKAPFEIRGFSLGNTALLSGSLITLSSFAEYFNIVGTEGGFSSIGFIYGLPICLIGAAMKYAEIPPVPVITTKEAKILYDLKKTETINQINSDVTRHRYGDEAHLDSTVKYLGLVLPYKQYPQLQWLEYNISETKELEFMMVWKSVDTPFRIWNDTYKIKKYDVFFGPNIWSQVIKVNGEEKLVGIKLTTGKKKSNNYTNIESIIKEAILSAKKSSEKLKKV